MAKKQTGAEQQQADGQEEPAQTFAQVWDGLESGRISHGEYSVYKTPEGGLHIAYRPEGMEEDQHLPLPAMVVQMMIAASEGKGPLGRLRQVALSRFGGG